MGCQPPPETGVRGLAKHRLRDESRSPWEAQAMSTDLEPSGKPEKRPLIKSRFPSLADFLTKQPPGSEADVSCHLEPTARAINFLIPDLWLDCENANCDGFRWFDGSVRETSIGSLHRMDVFLKYTCRNCRQTSKTYAISIGDQAENLMTVRKIGEWPPFGPRTPSRVITLIGPDRDLFLERPTRGDSGPRNRCIRVLPEGD